MSDKTEPATAAAAKDDGARTITLPASGKVVVLRKGKGRDMRIAARHVNPAQDPIGYSMALAATLATIEGNPVLPEDLDEMDMEDVTAIMGGLPGKSLPQGMPSP